MYATTLLKWIYIFHMPLFIFISGYFTRKKNINNLISSIWKLLEPLIIIQLIVRIPEFIQKETFSFRELLTPWWLSWYMLSLIYWRLLIQIIPDKILNKTILVIITAFCISIFAGFLPLNRFLSLQRTLSFMPFFFLGYYMKGKNIFLPKKFRLFSTIFLISMICIPLFYPQYLGSLTHHAPYGDYHNMFRRIFVFCLSIPMSLAFINICPNTPWSAQQGRYTMQYYIYHGLIIPPLMIFIHQLNVPLSLLISVICTTIIAIGIYYILLLSDKNRN